MAEKASISSVGVMSATPGTALYWDGGSGVYRDMGPAPLSASGQPSSFQATGPPATEHRVRLYWMTREIGLVPGLSPQGIVWEQEATLATFSLDPGYLADTAHAVARGARGELVWMPWPEQPASFPLAVHPALIVHAASEALQAARVTLVPALPVHDPLLHHIALVLQAALGGQGETGQLYAASLADALVVHFLRRYAAGQPSLRGVNGGLAPYKLRHTIAYINEHIEQKLSLAQLAAVAQTSPAHFTRLFKHATGLAPHQYVLMCRMKHAKRLLTETDLPLSELALQVGCADQSHFTALFRKHVLLTPKAYRDTTRR